MTWCARLLAHAHRLWTHSLGRLVALAREGQGISNESPRCNLPKGHRCVNLAMVSGSVVARRELTRFKETRERQTAEEETQIIHSPARAAREWLAREEGVAEDEGAASPDTVMACDLDAAGRRAAERQRRRLLQRRAMEARAAIERADRASRRVAELERLLLTRQPKALWATDHWSKDI